MTEFNWDSFIKELEKFQKGIENIGGHSRETIIEAPAKEEEILEVEKKLGYTLPKDFRDILLNYSSHFEYFWSTYRDEEEEQIEFPEKFCAIFAGNLHWGLDLLLDFEESRQGWVDICYPDYNNEYDKVWHNKLAFYEVGNGDYYGIELEKENYGKIVYLSHDGGDAHGHYIADNFKDLLNNWSKVGAVGGDDWQWEVFYTEGKGIDPESENAKEWREYIFSKIWKRGDMSKINNDWKEILEEEFQKDYFVELKNILEKEYENYTVYPPKKDILNAFFLTPYSEVKVVLLGQDPYHQKGQAHGLAFSVNFLVLDWKNFSKNLTTSVLDSNKIEQKADFYLEKNSNKLVIKNSKKMENVKSLAFSLSYDFSNLEINKVNSNFWKVENLWEKNSGIETFILNLDNKTFEKNEILVEINFSKKDEKLSSIINLFNSNFTDNKNEIYELTTSGISF